MAKQVKKMVVALQSEVKSKAVEGGERRIRFVASSVNQDRHYEKVNVSSLRLPLKKGGEMIVGAIPAEGVHDLVDIPLMLNHSADVRDTIGSVRSAFYENGELIFEAGISKREIAQEMLTLLEENHLSNAFSITMADYDYNFESETISNAEVIEVSLVFRGSNKEARLLAIKSLKGDKVEIEKRASTDNYGEVASQDQEATEAQTKNVEETTAEVEIKEEIKPKKEEKMKTHQEIAKDEIRAVPSQATKTVANDYINSKAAVRDFAEVLAKHAGESAEEVKKAWAENVKEKGVTNPETLLPGALVNVIKDSIEKSGTIFNVIQKTGLTVFRAMADTNGGDAETARAKGHDGKGRDKKELDITLVDRVLRGQYIYAYLTLNKEDLRENQDTGALVKFVMETLPKRVIREIERAIVLGDGRSANGDEITSFVSIKSDVKAANAFASKYTPAEGESLYESVVRASADIAFEGGLTLITSKKNATNLKLAKDKNGAFILPVGGDIKGLLGVENIFTPSWFNDTTETEFSAILFAHDAYKMVGDTSIESFTDFTLKQNKQEFLQELYAGGGLAEVKSAVGIAKS